MTKSSLAKAAGWVGGLLIASSAYFGKYAALALTIGGLLTGSGVHVASNTSADNPSGEK